jgi:hypothetical protein
MLISKSFDIREFVGPSIYRQYGESSTWFIQKQLVDVMQYIRDYFAAPVIINNWYKGGEFSERGFRLPDTPTGGKLSDHKRGMAADFNVKGMTAQAVNAAILAAEKDFLKIGVTAMEDIESTPTWTHVSVRWTKLDKILIVKPAEAVINSEDYSPTQDNYYIYENGQLVAIPFS